VTPSATSEPNLGVSRLVVNAHVRRCFLRPSLIEAPSLHRSYSASSVVRTSPPPHTAWPVSHELSVDRTAITAGVSRVASGLLCLHALAITPVGWMEPIRSYSFHPPRPSPISRWVGSCINRFEACSAFPHGPEDRRRLTAGVGTGNVCLSAITMATDPPGRTLHRVTEKHQSHIGHASGACSL